LFCGIPALIHSYKVIEDLEAGDYVKARRHSNISRKLNTYAAAIMFIFFCLFLAVIILIPDVAMKMVAME
jgi:hypothetical protein